MSFQTRRASLALIAAAITATSFLPSPAFASEYAPIPSETSQSDSTNTADKFFVVPIGEGAFGPDGRSAEELVGPICQVDEEGVSGYSYSIWDAMCMMADVRAVQDYIPYGYGVMQSVYGDWINMPGQKSTATRPSNPNDTFVKGWAQAQRW